MVLAFSMGDTVEYFDKKRGQQFRDTVPLAKEGDISTQTMVGWKPFQMILLYSQTKGVKQKYIQYTMYFGISSV